MATPLPPIGGLSSPGVQSWSPGPLGVKVAGPETRCIEHVEPKRAFEGNFHLENSKGAQGLCMGGKAGGRGWSPQARPMGHQGAHRPSRHPLLLAPTTPYQGYRQAERALPSSRKENRHIRGLSLRCLLLVPPTQSQSPPFPQVTSCPAILPADLTSPTLLLMQTFFLGFILDTSICTPLGTE